MHPLRLARRGFTLIELLVVVAIIALLISILLPSLRDAREQAKIARCLANNRQLMTTTVTYFLDYNNNFPFSTTDGGNAIATWFYGGKTNHDRWLSDSGKSIFFMPVEKRPFNPYLLGGKIERDTMFPDGTRQRVEVEVVHCPGDRTSHQYLDWGGGGANQTLQQISTYDDVGTTYQYNMHVFDPGKSGSMGGNQQNTVVWPWGGDLWYDNGRGWTMAGQLMTKAVLQKQASTFVMFLPDPMDWGSTWKSPEIGTHGKINKHEMGFLDGHAEYKTGDTRGYCGLGWEMIVRDWVWYYDMLDAPPPPYYQDQGINCDPPN